MALSWIIDDEKTLVTDELLGRLQHDVCIVPALWFLEVTNAFGVAERRGRTSPDNTLSFIKFLEGLHILVDHESHHRAFEHILPLSRTHGLTAYDAAYLDLALRSRLPLATMDGDLRIACMDLGIEVLG